MSQVSKIITTWSVIKEQLAKPIESNTQEYWIFFDIILLYFSVRAQVQVVFVMNIIQSKAKTETGKD